jgi:hypothetical protein
LLGCLFILGSNVANSIWIILQVFNFLSIIITWVYTFLTKMIIITIIITLYINIFHRFQLMQAILILYHFQLGCV